MNTSVKFNYLYRDMGNYKNWNEIVFPNPDRLASEEIDNRLRSAFDQEVLFIAHQIGIPEIFLYLKNELNLGDHCFHEYESVEIGEFDLGMEARTITQFLESVELAATTGWSVFAPSDRLSEIRESALRCSMGQ